ncbi:MAG: hypothetical protein CL928_05425 [Deltaproteobacteria bacterium]|nr:hypothetical protein [Deltaproteobacteria bacterium]
MLAFDTRPCKPTSLQKHQPGSQIDPWRQYPCLLVGRELINHFSWSNSRARLFSTCLRAYWWRYYAHWGGWATNAPLEARVAYRLGKMDSLASWAGKLVHDVIQEAIEDIRDRGRPVDGERLRVRARALLRAGWAESRRGAWIDRPKWKINLREHYFGDDEALSRERTDAIAHRVYSSLEGFVSGPYPDLLGRVSPGGFRNIEQLASLNLDGKTVYVKPDLAFHHPDDDMLWLVDWKTGASRAEDQLQLATYALFARENWGVEPSNVKGVLVYLAAGEERTVPVGPADLRRAEDAIRQSMTTMLQLLDDKERNLGSIDQFPPTDERTRCDTCNFQQLCFGTAGIPGALRAGDEE